MNELVLAAMGAVAAIAFLHFAIITPLQSDLALCQANNLAVYQLYYPKPWEDVE